MKNPVKLILVLSSIVLTPSVFGQNLEKIGKKDMLTFSGGLNYSSNINEVYGKPRNRDPFSWVVGGNFTLKLIDFSLPFTFSFTNQGGKYTQPFNITALHPTYKKFKSHVGIISMSFSPYTLSGLNFAGAGIEYSPGNWKIQAFGGRLKKQVQFDPELNNIQTMAYKRWGCGVSIGYELKGYSATLHLLKASDVSNSLNVIPNDPTITPMDNLVASMAVKGKIGNAINWNAEYASSILTRNILLEESIDRTSFSGKMAPLVQGNQSTISFGAFNAALNYRFKVFSFGGKYERIDPGYQTLGGMYFNNDFENITVTPTLNLLKGKLNLNINAGIQRNNLTNKTANASKRWVGTVSLSSSPFKNFNISGSYSNFSSFSRRNPANDPFYNPIGDTLNFYQISTNSNLSINYNLGKKNKHVLMLTGTYSESENITGRLENAAAFGFQVEGDNSTGKVKVYTGLFGHTISITKDKSSMGWTVNMNQSESLLANTLYIGPGINYSRKIGKLIAMNAGLTYNQNYKTHKLENHVLNSRVGFSAKPELWDKKYGSLSLSFNASLVNRFPVNSDKSQGDIALIFNLNYSF